MHWCYMNYRSDLFFIRVYKAFFNKSSLIFQGPMGKDGPDGSPGAAGPRGPDGSAGVQGAAGAAGDAGQQGKQGPEGRRVSVPFLYLVLDDAFGIMDNDIFKCCWI